MGSAGVHLGGALGLQRGGRGHKRAARVDHVVVQDADLVGHVADKRGDLGVVVLRAIVVHDGDVAIERRRELLRRLRATHVRRDHAQTLGIEAFVAEVIHEDGHGRHVVHGDVEEALDGILVQIHRDDVVDAGDLEQIGHELGRDGLARGGLAVLTGVTVVRDDRRDGAGACTLGGIGHDEQLHEGVVHVEGLARLDEEHVGAADGLPVAGVDLAVGELLVLDVAEVHVQVLGDLLGQLRIHRAGEQDHALGHLGHRVRPFCDGSFSFGYCSTARRFMRAEAARPTISSSRWGAPPPSLLSPAVWRARGPALPASRPW